MSRRYSVEDLLKLRASPLVSKPSNLPPIEEWMGVQDTATKRPATRGRQEDASQSTEGFQKRSAFESSQRKLGTDPERIVLGPPRRSFASSNGKPFGKYNSQDLDEVTRERAHERKKTGEELENKFGERKGFGTSTGRQTNRHEYDGHVHDRSRRRFDDEDGDTRPQRDYDRAKWSLKESRDEKALEDDGGENGNTRSGTRRDQGRSKFEQPWFRNDKNNEDARRETDRGGGWRQNRVKDGDWDLPGKGEIDPEWMDSAETSEPFQVRTQEDFQRWKERMKAGTSGTNSKVDEPGQLPEKAPIKGDSLEVTNPPASLISPDPSGNSMDKFFARFNDTKSSGEEKPAAKPATKTRFASIFGPQGETKPDIPATKYDAAADPLMLILRGQQGEPKAKSKPVPSTQPQDPLISLLRGEQGEPKAKTNSTPSTQSQDPLMSLLRGQQGEAKHKDRPAQDTPTQDPLMTILRGPPQGSSSTINNNVAADADQAGFQRILQMLGKREPGLSVPVESQKSHTSNVPGAHTQQRHASPDLFSLFKQDNSVRQPPITQPTNPPPGFEHRIDSRSPAETQARHSNTPAKDDLLLNLLRQAENSTKPQPQAPYQEYLGPPGLFRSVDPGANGSRPASDQERPEMQERGSARSIFDDPAISSLSYPENLQRRPPNAIPPGFDNAYMDNQRINPTAGKQMHNMPPGLQRPPGLDQMPRPPPGWNQQQQQQPQGPPPQGRPGPPPGLGSRGVPPFTTSPQSSMPPQLPSQGSTRPPSQRKHTGDSAVPSFPPGMRPPPGYLGHGPPPGFQHANAAQAAQNYGRFAMGGNDHPSLQHGPPPPGIGRGFMDLFAGERDGMRGPGGVPLPPGFR